MVNVYKMKLPKIRKPSSFALQKMDAGNLQLVKPDIR
jgi:hypothetical protein